MLTCELVLRMSAFIEIFLSLVKEVNVDMGTKTNISFVVSIAWDLSLFKAQKAKSLMYLSELCNSHLPGIIRSGTPRTQQLTCGWMLVMYLSGHCDSYLSVIIHTGPLHSKQSASGAPLPAPVCLKLLLTIKADNAMFKDGNPLKKSTCNVPFTTEGALR